MTYGELYEYTRNALKNADIENSEFDSRCIFEDFTGLDRLRLALESEREAPEEAVIRVKRAAEKRCTHYPLQYILGEWEFYGMKFRVGEGVLIPRADTETLVDAVVHHFAAMGKTDPAVIELCSGSGCIAAALKKTMPAADVTAIELSSDVMPYLVSNIRDNKVNVKIIKGDVTDGRLLDNYAVPDSVGDYRTVDAIVSNPPYLTGEEMANLQTEVTFEPAMALDGGEDGLKFYRIISCLWREILSEGGLLAFEIGFEQGKAVTALLESSGYENIQVLKDTGGNDRVVLATKRKE
jgi:release factor glutamine methyltransferase